MADTMSFDGRAEDFATHPMVPVVDVEHALSPAGPASPEATTDGLLQPPVPQHLFSSSQSQNFAASPETPLIPFEHDEVRGSLYDFTASGPSGSPQLPSSEVPPHLKRKLIVAEATSRRTSLVSLSAALNSTRDVHNELRPAWNTSGEASSPAENQNRPVLRLPEFDEEETPLSNGTSAMPSARYRLLSNLASPTSQFAHDERSLAFAQSANASVVDGIASQASVKKVTHLQMLALSQSQSFRMATTVPMANASVASGFDFPQVTSGPQSRKHSLGSTLQTPADDGDRPPSVLTKLVTDLNTNDQRKQRANLMDLPTELLRFTADHYLAIRHHNDLRLISRRWNSIVTSNCTLWHRRLPPVLFSERVRSLLDSCRLHSVIQEMHAEATRRELLIEAEEHAHHNHDDSEVSVTVDATEEDADSYDALRVERFFPRDEAQAARLRVTYCFNGCCYATWREDNMERLALQEEERVINALITAASGVSKALFFPNASSHSCNATVVTSSFLCLLLFLSLLSADVPLYFVFIPMWGFFILLYPTMYAFYSASQHLSALAGFLLVFCGNLSALIAYFLGEREANTPRTPFALTITLSPVIFALLGMVAVAARDFVGWLKTRGLYWHPATNACQVVSYRALLLLSASMCIALLLLGSVTSLALEVDFYHKDRFVEILPNTTITPAPLEREDTTSIFVVSGCMLGFVGILSASVIVAAAQILSFEDIWNEEPHAAFVMISYTLAFIVFSVEGFMIATGTFSNNTIMFQGISAVVVLLLMIGNACNASFKKEPDRVWWLGYALYPN